MNCPACEKEVMADRLFCTWCESYMPKHATGTKAGLFRRWFASVIDPVLIILAFLIPAALTGGLGTGVGGEGFGGVLVLLTLGAVLILFFRLFAAGMTPGKYLLGEQVVEKLTGRNPGFVRMLIRETVGKFVSGLFFGLGFFWAIWDNDAQAWHDKIAGTVVVHRKAAAAPAQSAVMAG